MLARKKNLMLLPIFLMAISHNLSLADDNQDHKRRDKLDRIHDTEAPAGFDGLTNGLVDQSTFEADRRTFEERDTINEGLGPVYNAESCSSCHQNPVTGSASQISVVRAGIFDGTHFYEPPGGSMMPDRAIDAAIQAQIYNKSNIRSLRLSLNTLGDGFVEAIADETIKKIAAFQPQQSEGVIHGEAILVDVLEAPGIQRIGRFGWKNQHASLFSFSGDAYRNEIGITNPLLPTENTSNGRSVAAFDKVADPEDDGTELHIFTEFMRASKVPPRDRTLATTSEAQAGERLFRNTGCEICHVSTFTTAPEGTAINGGTFTLPKALGNKIIHPYSDFLLHDVGTGDGIVQNGGLSTRNKLRTSPLWGLRTRNRLLHDGSALTINDAIASHRGEAANVTKRFDALSQEDKNKLLSFLHSL